MMYGRGKSELCHSSCEAGEQGRATLRSRWSKGQGPRGRRHSETRAGHRTGKACPRRWTAFDQSRRGRFLLRRKSRGDRMRAKLWR